MNRLYRFACLSLSFASLCLFYPELKSVAQATPPGSPGLQAGGAPPQMSPEVQKAAKQWEVAVGLQKANKSAEAVSAYQTFIRLANAAKLAPSATMPAYQNLAVLYRGTGQTKELVSVLKTLLSIDPKSLPAYAELATIYRKNGQTPELISTLQKFVALEPKSVPAYAELSTLYRKTGQAKELLGALQKLAVLDSKNAQAHIELAYLYTIPAFKNLDEAKKEAKRAIELKPNAPTLSAAYTLLGLVAGAKSDFAGAEVEFQNAVRENPKNAQAHYQLALLLADRKKYPQALTVIRKASELEPKNAQTKVYLAVILERMGKNPEALQALLEAKKLAPGDPTILFNLAQIHQRMGNVNDAIASYQSFVARVPSNYAANMNLGELYTQIGNQTAARQFYMSAHRIDGKDSRALQALAQTELTEAMSAGAANTRQSLLKLAEEHFRELAAIDPKTATSPGGLARYYERIGQFAKAQEIYKKRLETDPADGNAHIQIGRLYLMQRMPEEAITTWKKYRDLRPDDPSSYEQIAVAYENQGKWAEAIADWRALLARKPKPGLTAAVSNAIAKDLSSDKKPKEARAQFEETLKLDRTAKSVPEKLRLAEISTIQSEQLEAMRRLSNLAREENNFDEAIRWLQQVKTEEAVQSEKNHSKPNPQIYRDIAKLYEQAKKPELAIKELDTLTTILPEDATVYESLAQAYEGQSKQAEAISAYRKAAVVAKDPLNYRIKIAESYQRTGKLAESIQEYEEIQREFPKETRYLNSMASTYRQAGKDEAALKTYDALLANDPRAYWALDQKAVILTHLKRYDEARAIYEKQLLRTPENRQLYADVAYIYAEEKKPDDYLNWVSPRFEKTPANTTLMSVVIDEYIRQKQEDKGWNYIRGVVAKQKPNRSLLEATVVVMNQHNRKEDALTVQRQIAALDPKDLNAQTNLAESLASAGHPDEALKLYRDLIERKELPGAQKLLLRRQFARTAGQVGSKDEQIKQLKLIVAEVPDDYDALTTLAQLYVADKKEADAIPLYMKLATQEAYNARVRSQIRVKIGELYEKIGKKEDAISQYREALKLNSREVAATDALKRLGEKI